MATWCEELTHSKRPWCWARLKSGGEGDNRGLDGWMASLIRWTWVWAGSRSWWWTGKAGVLQSMGSQRVRHDWVTESNCGSLGVAPGPSSKAFSLRLEEERWRFPTWMDRCVSPCWGGYPILFGKGGGKKICHWFPNEVFTGPEGGSKNPFTTPMTKKGTPEEWNQRLQPFNVSQWAQRKGNTCHLAVIRLWPLQPLPTVNPKETQNAGLQAPDGWGTYQGNNFSEPWLLSLPICRKALNFLTWDLVSWIWSSTFLSLQV